MIERCIEEEEGRKMLVRYLNGLPLPFTIKITDGRLRSVEQNRLQWMWAAEAALQRPGMTQYAVQREWKLLIGIPILLTDDGQYAKSWAMVEKVFNYEQRLAMMDIIDVTQKMTVKQLKAYLDQVWDFCAENGIVLTSPEDLKYGTKRTQSSTRMDRSNTGHADTAADEEKDRPKTEGKVR